MRAAAAAHLLLGPVSLRAATTVAVVVPVVHRGLPMPVNRVLEFFNLSLGKT